MDSLSDKDFTAILLESGKGQQLMISGYMDIKDPEVISKCMEKVSNFSREKDILKLMGLDSNANSTFSRQILTTELFADFFFFAFLSKVLLGLELIGRHGRHVSKASK